METIQIAYWGLILCRLVGSFVLYRIAVRYFERTNNPPPTLGKILIFAVMYFIVAKAMIIVGLRLIQLIGEILVIILSTAID